MALNMLAIEGQMVRLINPYFVRPFVRRYGRASDLRGGGRSADDDFVPVKSQRDANQAVCRVGEAGGMSKALSLDLGEPGFWPGEARHAQARPQAYPRQVMPGFRGGLVAA